jgi:hypothetical protein
MTVLSLVTLSFAYRAAQESRSAQARAVTAQLRAHASSAVTIALARLAENTNDYDHPAEPWHSHLPLASEEWMEEWQEERGSPPAFETHYQVIDEEGKLNLLYASGQDLETVGLSAGQIASLYDWMDADDVARSEGAENACYLARPAPYRCKNAPLELLEELRLIRGFGIQDYRGEDVNRNRSLEPAENDGDSSHPPDNADGVLQAGWVGLLTVRGDGRVNINTAPRPVLDTLSLNEGAVRQIVDFRRFDADSSGDLEDHVFRSHGDIDQLQGLTEADRDLLHGIAAFRSAHFRIFAQSRHLDTGLGFRVEVLARVEGERPKVLLWRAGALARVSPDGG